METRLSAALTAALTALALLPAAAPAAAGPTDDVVTIRVLSDRADLVAGGTPSSR